MRRAQFICAFFCACVAVGAAGVSPVVSIASLRAGTSTLNSPSRLVTVRGVVTTFSGWENSFFLQDQTGAISVDRDETTPVHAGDEVEVMGMIRPGFFAPVLRSGAIRVLRQTARPEARPSTYSELLSGKFDSRWIEVAGIVRSAHVAKLWGKPTLSVDLRTGGGAIAVQIPGFAGGDIHNLVDSAIRVRGACGTVFNDRQQLVGLRLFVPDLSQLQIETAAPDSWQMPLSLLSSLLRFNRDTSPEHRVRISGIVTYQTPGEEIYLQSVDGAIRIETSQPEIFQLGDRVEAVGFVTADGSAAILESANVRLIAHGTPPMPVLVNASQVIQNKDGFTMAPYNGLLIRLEGKIIDRLPQTHSQLWLFESGSTRFQAELSDEWRARNFFESGSQVTLTGICQIETDNRHNPRAFRVLLRTASDIVVRRTPYTTISAVILGSALLLILGAFFLFWLHQHYFGKPQAGLHTPIPIKRVHAFRRMGRLLALAAAGVGSTVLCGWALDLPLLKSVHSGYPEMQPTTALCLLAMGCAVWLSGSRKWQSSDALSDFCSAVAAAIAAVTLIEYFTGWDLRFEGILFQTGAASTTGAGVGRMSMVAAFCFLLLSVALFVKGRGRLTALSQLMTLFVGMLSLLGLNSYLFGIHVFHGLTLHAAMAVHTAAGMLLLSSAILFLDPDHGLMRPISSPSPGGMMSTFLLPCALTVPSILGWIRWQGQLHGYYDLAFGLALMVSASAVCFAFVIWSTASLLNRLDQGRTQAEAEIRRLNETLEATVVERTAQLRESQTKFRAMIDSVVEYSIMTLDAGGMITSWNSGAERQKGYTAEEIVGKHFSTFYSAEERASGLAEEELRIAVATGACTQEGWRFRKNGERFWAEVTISAVHDEDGSLRGFTKITHDITERKRAEQENLRLNEKLRGAAEAAQAANRAKSVFLSTMSHEIRTPMNAILGYAQLMSRDPKLDAGVRANLQIMERSGEHLLKLINDVLDLAKIEAGRTELYPTPFPLAKLVDDLSTLFRQRAEAKDLRFDVLSESDANSYAIADENKLRQILINLVGNAIKFTKRGYVQLAIRLNPAEDGRMWLAAEVRDSGPGLGGTDVESLFEPFNRNQPEVNVVQGSGLGLSISRKYARLMGGDISVISKNGSGSVFKLEVPVERCEAPEGQTGLTQRVQRLRPGTKAPTILVVDDIWENRDWVTKLLVSVGFVVIGAGNGEEAVEAWREKHPDLILMDVHMPVMDGLEATRRIKADAHGKPTPVVLLSASAFEERLDADRCEADSFLLKPCMEGPLLERIAALLGLSYEFAEPPMQPQPPADLGSALIELSESLRSELTAAVHNGNKKRLSQLIGEVEDSGANGLTALLRRLADNYEYDALIELLEPPASPHPPEQLVA